MQVVGERGSRRHVQRVISKWGGSTFASFMQGDEEIYHLNFSMSEQALRQLNPRSLCLRELTSGRQVQLSTTGA